MKPRTKSSPTVNGKIQQPSTAASSALRGAGMCDKATPPIWAHVGGEPFLPVNKAPAGPNLFRAIPITHTSYHWHYFEFVCPRSNTTGVVIVSLQDPFAAPASKAEQEIPASVYLTFRHAKTHTLTHYAYELLYGTPAKLMRQSFLRFLESGEPFEWHLSRLGARKGYTISLKRTCAWLPHPASKQMSTQQDTTDENHQLMALEAFSQHHWHLLHPGPFAPAQIAIEEFNPDGWPRPDQRARALWDIPSDIALSWASRRSAASSSVRAAESGLQASCVYWDSNFGSEPLHQFSSPWIWRRQARGEHTSVAYIFPKEHLIWTVENGNLSLNHLPPNHPQLAPSTASTRTFQHWAAAGTGLRSLINLFLPSTASSHEAAPFYLRFELPKKKALEVNGAQEAPQVHRVTDFDQSGTEEWMKPMGISSWPTRLLLPLRQTHADNHTLEKVGQAVAAALTRKNGQSFFVASKILSREARRNAYALYAICRIVDDATDECHGPKTGSAFSTALVAHLTQKGRDAEEYRLSEPLAEILARALRLQPRSVPVTDAAQFLAYARNQMHKLKISSENLRDLVDGQRDDEHFSQPNTFAEFYVYCYKVAGVVGLMMARVFGAPPEPTTDQAAEHLGIAMQITNILRDIREDLEEKGRIYLPADSCSRHHLRLADVIRDQTFSHGLQEVVKELGEKAIGYYQSALGGASSIPGWRERLCVRAMAAIYGSILAVLIEDPQQAARGRVVVPRFKKVLVFIAVLLGRHPLAAAGFSRHWRLTPVPLPNLSVNGLESKRFAPTIPEG
jgi:phytoene synthase